MRGLNSVDDKKVEMRKGQKGNAPLRKFWGGVLTPTSLSLRPCRRRRDRIQHFSGSIIALSSEFLIILRATML